MDPHASCGASADLTLAKEGFSIFSQVRRAGVYREVTKSTLVTFCTANYDRNALNCTRHAERSSRVSCFSLTEFSLIV